MVWPFTSSSDNSSKPPPPKVSPPETKASKEEVEELRKAFDPKKLPEREKLPPKLQNIVDKDDSFYDELVEGYVPPSTESNVRYAAYASRFRTILLSAHRYVAYTSDIGESFRPVAHPWLVRGAYGVSWLYILGDVSYEGYKSYWQNQRVLHPNLELTPRMQKVLGIEAPSTVTVSPSSATTAITGKPGDAAAAQKTIPPLEDYRTVMLQRGIFQSLASMGLPAFTIHSVVRYSGRALKDVKNKRIRTWGPIGLGLSIVPFLPALFDKPVENAVEWTFHKAFSTFGGQQAVGHAPMIGREKQLSEKPKKEQEKEL